MIPGVGGGVRVGVQAPLDAFSSQGRSQLRWISFSGGRLFSSYTGTLLPVRDADTGDTLNADTVAQALAFAPDLQLSAMVDQISGAIAPGTAVGTMGFLQESATPHTVPNGAIAYRIPDIAVPLTYVPAYQLPGSLGLPLDDVAIELWYDMHRDTSDEDGVYPIVFTKDQDYAFQVPFFSAAFNYTSLYQYSALTAGRFMPSPGYGGGVYLGFEALSDAFVRVIKPTAAQGADVTAYVNGVATGVFDDFGSPGLLTLAGTTETGFYAEPIVMRPVSFMAVVEGPLPAPDVALLNAFLTKLATPP